LRNGKKNYWKFREYQVTSKTLDEFLVQAIAKFMFLGDFGQIFKTLLAEAHGHELLNVFIQVQK